MAWHVVGMREKRYWVDTPDQVSAWVADEIDTITLGWVPLTSARDSDGALRVTYGMLPPELGDREPDPGAPVVDSSPHDAVRAGLAMMLAVCALATTFALFARP